jgi:hypothetical protein
MTTVDDVIYTAMSFAVTHMGLFIPSLGIALGVFVLLAMRKFR